MVIFHFGFGHLQLDQGFQGRTQFGVEWRQHLDIDA